MSNWLSEVLEGTFGGPDRIVIYGEEGIGKSRFAAAAPRPIFIDCEDGLGRIECSKFPKITSYQDVVRRVTDLYSVEHPYKTVVIDSLDSLERMIWNDVATKKGKENIEDIGYGKGYQMALSQWRALLDGCDSHPGLSALRDERGMRIILIAHEKIERFESPDSEPYDRYVPSLHKLLSQMVVGWADFVLFARYKVFTKKRDGGHVAQGVGSGEKVICTQERPSHLAKSRFALPEEIPLDWNHFEQLLKEAV